MTFSAPQSCFCHAVPGTARPLMTIDSEVHFADPSYGTTPDAGKASSRSSLLKPVNNSAHGNWLCMLDVKTRACKPGKTAVHHRPTSSAVFRNGAALLWDLPASTGG